MKIFVLLAVLELVKCSAGIGADQLPGTNNRQLKENLGESPASPQNSAQTAISSPPNLVKAPIPAKGAYLGAATTMKFPEFEKLIQRPLAIRYLPFTDNINFSTGNEESDTTLGALLRANSDHDLFPMVSFYHTNRTLSEILTNTINNKDNRFNSKTLPDDFARNWARGLKAYGKPIFFRWNSEMNGNWVTYCTDGKSPNSFDKDSGVKQKPGDYIAAWRHVHDIFAQEGATNVSWVWCPDASNPSAYANLYPGDAYVDWTALDGYNWVPPHPLWESFTKLFLISYNSIVKIAPSKPFMIGEFNSTVGSAANGSQKAAWFAKAAADIPQKFPNLKALILFDINANKEQDWRIENYPIVVQSFSSAFSTDYFLSGPPANK